MQRKIGTKIELGKTVSPYDIDPLSIGQPQTVQMLVTRYENLENSLKQARAMLTLLNI